MVLSSVSVEAHQEIHMDQLLTPAEVAARLRRPVATVRFWRTRGIGPKGANIGGRVLYRQSDVEAWLEEQFAKAG
jgi:DNA-binding transcriptional MerR regulator